MNEKPISKVTVIGSGTMGSQIAQLFAMKGIEVTITDLISEKLDWGVSTINQNLDQFFVKKEKLTPEQAKEVIDRIHVVSDFEQACSDARMAVEAVFEDLAVKVQVFEKLDKYCLMDSVLATNTSGLSITEIAEATQHPERVAGFHFFNPVAVMKLVEVVKGENTSNKTIALLISVAEYLGKTPITCEDIPAFVANRLYEALLKEAFWLVFEGIASPEAVDTAMKLGYNFPIGPMELQDRIGTWGLILHQPNQRFIPNLTPKGKSRLRLMLSLRYLGRYSESVGKGVYDFYNEYIAT